MNNLCQSVATRLSRLALTGILSVTALLSISLYIESDGARAQQNLILGKLAIGTQIRQFNPTFPPNFYIGTVQADGTGLSTINGPNPSPRQPAWSADGTRIVFTVAGSGGAGSEIYAMNADGSGPTNLTNSTASESNSSWSSAGKIAYERENQVWTMNQDGSNQAQFTAITQPSPTGPAFSADGSKIAFSSAGEIWKINADGTGEQRVTNNATNDTDPAWSPDGSKIVFSNGSGISVIVVSGTNETALTNLGDRAPSWSFDGTTIAFKRVTSPAGIYVMDVTGANQVRIVSDTTGLFAQTNDDPAWQPVAQAPNTFSISGRVTGVGASLSGATVSLSGTTNAIATTDLVGNYQFSGLPPGGTYTVSPSFTGWYFTPPSRSFSAMTANQIADFVGKEFCIGASCARNGRIAYEAGSSIFSINPDGSNPLFVTSGTFPNFSTDGTKIAFASGGDIWRANADGTNPVQLTTNPASDINPYHSPDGASIVFVSNRDGNNEIYKMNSDGSNQVRLTNESTTDFDPAFSPDGQKIIFVTARLGGQRLFTMNADGTNQQVISDINGAYNRPSYSPDGSKIIFSYQAFEPADEIWTMNADGTNRTRILSSRKRDPAYSPDGNQFAYVCCFNIEIDINGIHTTGRGRITTSPGDRWPTWQRTIAPRRTAFDFDGDGRSDISVFRPSDRIWYLLRSEAGFTATQWGLSTDVLAPADYDGDLKTDIAVWRGSEGRFYILNSFDSTIREEFFGIDGDLPMPHDWDADSRADLTVYRAGSQSFFHYRATGANPNGNISVLPWGVSGDKPVLGDYDGDGRTDAAVYRPSNAVWYVRQSSNGQLYANTFGISSDKPVPADYDADGKTDLAVYRDGVWYLLRSTEGFLAFNYGLAGDTPVPADYDGDGRADPAVYRNGVWYRLRSTGGDDVIAFGLSNDKPIPAAQIP